MSGDTILIQDAMGEKVGKFIQLLSTFLGEAGTIVEQTVGAIRTVASFTGEKQAIEKYNQKLKVAYNNMVQQGLATGVGLGTFMLIVFCTYGLAIWYGSKMIIEKGYNGGQVINVMFAIMTGGMSLGQTSPSLNAFAAGKAAAYKMLETIKRTPKIDTYDTTGFVLEDVKGESGSGKSTVISLVERFYDPEAGEVLIDGVNLKKLHLRSIRERIGLVSQEPNLFTTTIKQNIAYGKENSTEEEIRRAMELANAAKFIDKLPQGLDTMVGEHGTSLSGGQKQRIAIARAILKNPRILLLDEATSALDTESERIVQDALVRLMSNRTTIVVAHRLTTIRTADAIAVVHKGKIVEKGTHDELTKDPEGAYSQLIRLQNRAKETDTKLIDLDIGLDIDRTMLSSGSRRLSVGQSLSRGSSGSRLSSTISSFGTPALVNIQVTEVGDEESLEKTKADPEGAKNSFHQKPLKCFMKPHTVLREDSKTWAGVYVGMGFFGLAVIPVQNFFFAVAGGKLIEQIRFLTFQKVVHQQISWFDDPANSSGAIGARLSSDASTVKALVGDALALIAQNIATIIAGLIIGFTANWKLALLILAVSPLMIMQGVLQTKCLKGFSADAKVMYEEASQVANDAIGSIRTVASFCSERKVMDAYEKKCEAPMKQGVRLGVVSGVGFGFSFFVMFCTNALIFYLGAILVKHGQATFEQVFMVFFALTISAVGVSESSGMAPDSNKAKDSTASIFKILDSKPKIDSSSDAGITLPSITGEIDLEHVSFKYPTRPDMHIFRDICLKIPSGKTVALVGESGSGKSTVIALIERFYDPDSGRVLLDGVEIQKFKLNWLRQQIGLRGDVTEEEIIKATKASNAHNFISSLPQGYDTSVGERGVQLSGGQKQRIAIARAILKDPKILLLDEATSALDAESERIVQDALDRVMVNRTTVVVAHRLTTIKGADIIAVVKNGVIAEKGSHDFLMKITDGAYASLVALHSSST
ncbi:hypothetical protein M0R45_031028 [Rubus argutus]|uniref:Uncharacterized protein n=1 Tax=Rubus argutus TaxID=59490 RepID=A0AAW1WCV5_RUBAR